MTEPCSTGFCGTGGWSGPLPGDPGELYGLTATTVLGGIELSWFLPNLNPHAVAYTGVYRGNSANFNNALKIEDSAPSRYFDQVTPEVINQEYFYWVQQVSVNGTLGPLVGPASAVARPTSQQLLEVLEGAVGTSQLNQELTTEIARITEFETNLEREEAARLAGNLELQAALEVVNASLGQVALLLNDEMVLRAAQNLSLVGTVNTLTTSTAANATAITAEAAARVAQVSAETTARVTAIGGETAARVLAITNEVARANASDEAVKTVLRSEMTSGSATSYANAQAYVQGYTYAKATIDGSLATVTTSLTAAYQAGDTAAVNTSRAYTESYSYAKATVDGAIAASAATLTTAFQAADTAALATARTAAETFTQTYAYNRSTVDGAIAAQGTTLTTAFNAADAAKLTEAKTYAENWAYSKSASNAAEAAQNSVLRAEFAAADTTGYSNAQAYVQGYSYSKSTSDSALASASNTLRAEFAAGNALTYSNAQAYVQGYSYSKATVDSAVATSSTTLEAKLSNRANLLRNSGFEAGLDLWSASSAGWSVVDSSWGRYATHNALTGTGTLTSLHNIPVDAGAAYTISADTMLQATSGFCYVDLLFYNSSNTLLLDSAQAGRAATHNFQEGSAGRSLIAVSATAPAGATYVRARFVWQDLVGMTAIGVRQIKVERGSLPSTPYTTEAMLVYSNARIDTVSSTLTTTTASVASLGTALRAEFAAADTAVSSAINANLASNYYTRAAADTATATRVDTLAARMISRPNVLPNGSFERGMVGWVFSNLSGTGVTYVAGMNAAWGPLVNAGQSFSGTGVLEQTVSLGAGWPMVISGDAGLSATSGVAWIDVLFYNNANTLLGSISGAQRVLPGFSTTDAGRLANTGVGTTPAGTTKGVVRLVYQNVVGGTYIGFRQIKLEYGSGPATPYSAEGTLVNFNTSIETVQTSIAATNSSIASTANTLRTEFAAADTAAALSAQSYTQTYAYSKTTIDGTLATLGSVLRSEFNAGDTTTLNAVNANLSTNYYTRAAADSATASSIAVVNARIGLNETAVVNLSSTVATNQTTNATQLGLVNSRLVIRPNLLKNGGFERGMTDWATYIAPGSTGNALLARSEFSAWGGFALFSGAFTGSGSIYSSTVSVSAGWVLTMAADSNLVATSGRVSLGMQFFDAGMNLLLQVEGPSRANTHSFDNTGAGRDILDFQATVPANAVLARALCNWVDVVGGTTIAFRQVKLEYGALPATAYSADLQLSLLDAAIKTEATTRTDGLASQAALVTDLQATVKRSRTNRLRNGGFESGDLTGWSEYHSAGTVVFIAGVDPVWGAVGYMSAAGGFSGTHTLYSSPIAVGAGVVFTVSGDTAFNGSGGVSYLRMVAYNASMAVVAYSTGSTSLASHGYGGMRDPQTKTWTTPAGTAFVAAEVVFENLVGATYAGARQVKLEQGDAPATPYTMEGSVSNAYAALKTEATTRANVDGSLLAQYTVKTDLNGYVAGYGLASTLRDSVPSSSFIVRADTFAVGTASGPGITPRVPFIVKTVPYTMASGFTVPAGVYMEGAYIVDLNADVITTGLLKATRIDTRGLDIRDNAGNVIFSAGSSPVNLPANRVIADAGWLNNGISINSAGQLLGIGGGAGQSVANNTDTFIRSPGGATSINSTNRTGAIEIRLPVFFNYAMVKMTVEIFEYATGLSCTLEVAGYNYAVNNSWYNCTARVIGGNVEYPVRFGHDGTKCCIWIGANNENWDYPQVVVKDVLVGYIGYSRVAWESGWQINFVTDVGTATRPFSVSILDTLPGADWSKTARRPANISALTGSEAILNSAVTPAGIGAVNTNLSNAPTGIRNDQISVSGGQLWGVGTGAGTLVANSSIGVSAGRITGIGTGDGALVDNTQITDNLIPDSQYRSPAWWGVSNWSGVGVVDRHDGDVALMQPRHFMQHFVTGNSADYMSQFIPVEQGAVYRLKIRIWVNASAAGVFWAGMHLPNQEWFTPAPANSWSPDNGLNLDTIKAAMPTLSGGGKGWVEYTAVRAIAANQFQLRIRNTLTAGSVDIHFELQRVFSLDRPGEIAGQITAATASTFIANAALGSAQIGQLLAGNLAVTELSKVVSGGAVSGARVQISTNKVEVFDGVNGFARVTLGYIG